jgi:hypothetical protein
VSRFVLMAVAAALLACSGSGLDDSLNVPPLERYADVLVQTSAAPVTRGPCGMFTGTRSGWCRLQGDAAGLAAFTSSLGLVPGSAAEGSDTCAALPGFAAAQVFVSGSATLPTNTDNVHLRRVYVSGGDACIDFEYPYG